MITVYIARFGHDEVALTVPEGTTVEQALAQAGVRTSTREKLFVDNVPAPSHAVLEDGDILSVVTPKQAG